MVDWSQCFSDVFQSDGDGDVVMWWMPNGVRWSDESQRSVSALKPSEGCICIWPGWILEGGLCVWSSGCGWWWMRTEQEKDEAWNRMRMKDREVLAGLWRGKETVRQRWRDWEWRKNEGQRETNLLWKLLMFAPLSCTVASRLNLHLLRQYQVSVSGAASILPQLSDLWRSTCQWRRHWKGKYLC